jgi:hypothetical protein
MLTMPLMTMVFPFSCRCAGSAVGSGGADQVSSLIRTLSVRIEAGPSALVDRPTLASTAPSSYDDHSI